MHSSVMNTVIKLLHSQGNSVREIKFIASVGVGERPIKAVTDVLAQVLGFSGVNFCLDIRLKEVTFVMCKVFNDFLN